MKSLSILVLIAFILLLDPLHGIATLSPSIQSSQNYDDLDEVQPPCIIVIFGATGDLTTRKLLPAIYNLEQENHLSANTIVVGCARSDLTDQVFRTHIGEAIDQFSRTSPRDAIFWQKFANTLFYHQVTFDMDETYESLGEYLSKIDSEFGTLGNRIFYLATQPSHFPIIIEQLYKHRLVYDSHDRQKWSRVIIEKPFGLDLNSAIHLQEHISKYLDDSQVFSIDHYLGKTGVQALLNLRFEDGFFEPFWNNQYIDHVQITLSEAIGIETRGHFWESTGALRDLFQNHLMQLLTLVAMEPPEELSSENIQMKKIDVLKTIQPFSLQNINRQIIRGQYGFGIIDGKTLPGYREELDVSETSNVETYVAAKLFIDNERWQGVPFYIRGGKRLAKRTAEIGVTFKKTFDGNSNTLFICIQPNVGVFLRTGQKESIQSISYRCNSDTLFGKSFPEAYEKLIYDAIQGNKSLFVQAEEQIAAWRLLTPVLHYWNKNLPEKFPNYDAGSWGPEAADQMLRENGHRWELLEQ